ncbi:hypothetical protein, partial [Streptomyces sp. NPDC058677]|uniref:hypothetical protein n=1 Tax=Streptomyces sp. NPDC058677 TaxID=3346594 RepID=UPI0036552938
MTESAIRRATPGFRYGVARHPSLPGPGPGTAARYSAEAARYSVEPARKRRTEDDGGVGGTTAEDDGDGLADAAGRRERKKPG